MSDQSPIQGMLAGLVIDVGAERFSAGVTLTFDGMLISGMLISIRQFYAGLQDLLAQEGSHATTTLGLTIQASLDKLPATLPPPIEGVRPTMIYMRDTVCVIGTGVYPLGFWSGRYDAVTGWTLGKLSINERP